MELPLFFFSLFLSFCFSASPLLRNTTKMQSTALALSPSTQFLKPPCPSPILKLFQLSKSSSSIRLDHSQHVVHRLFSQRTSSISSLLFNAQISVPFPVSTRRFENLVVRAASLPESGEDAGKTNRLAGTLQLGAMFGIWYLLNIYFNILNKQVLKVYPFPATVTAFQFGCGTVIVILMWTFNLYTRPKISRSQFAAILPLAVAHTMGNLLTNISLGKVAVSFTHTIKAMEPFFTVLLSALFLAERPSLWVFSSLVPIVGGVALASFTEASFNWTGFCTAMASNVTNQSRNVLSKKLMVKKEDSLDNINLFSVITIISFTLLVPSAILLEGIKFSPSYLQSAANQGLNIKDLLLRSLLTGVCFHSYQQVSYMILEMVSAVTHAVGNCVKRVVVIISSVIFFRTPVSAVNALGTAMALAGVFWYSKAKRIKPKSKVA